MNVANIETDVLRDFSFEADGERESRGQQSIATLVVLRRMFKLAEREGKVSNVAYFPMQKGSEPREGCLERPEFERLRAEMLEPLRPTVTFCYETGPLFGEQVIVTPLHKIGAFFHWLFH